MSRIISVKPNLNSQHFQDTFSHQSQVGLRKTLEISQPVHVFTKKSDNSISPHNEAVKSVSPHNEGAQCRICLQTQLQSQQKLIQPCQCTGSVQSVHQGCFTEWISRSLSTKSNQQLSKIAKEGIKCDLCKMKFEIKFSFQKICINMEKLKLKIKRRQFQFAALMFMLTLCVTLFAVTLALLPENPFEINLGQKQVPQTPQTISNGRNDWLKVVLLGSIGILVMILTFVLYLLISEYGFTYRTEFGYKGKRQLKTIKGIVMD